MSDSDRPWPYDLPIWRTSHRAVSPDGRLVAEIAQAAEVSMGNPTSGTLRLSNGLELARCSPSFLWSDDSRYLAVPMFLPTILFGRQRLVVLDLAERGAYASAAKAAYVQPESFANGWLEVTAEPFRRPKRIRWRWPDARSSFRPLELRWPTS